MLFARLVFGPRLFSYESGETGIHVQSWKDGYITDFPGFCTGCVGGYTSITPFTPTDQFDRLSRVNFSCLTRLIPCQAVDQILPAWKKRPYDEDNWGDPHCLVPLDVRAREADNILLVEVARNTPNLEWGPNHWATYVHILDKLKNAPNEEVGSSFGIAEMGAFLNPVTLPAPSKTSPSPPLPVGARYVVLYPEERLPLDKTPDPSACSVTLATPQNIALIQSGIAQDPSVGESYHLRD